MQIQISPNAFYQQLEDHAVILNLQSEQYYTLDMVGRDIWEALSQYGNLDQTVTTLLETYQGVTEKQLQQDIISLITELQQEGLILVKDSQA